MLSLGYEEYGQTRYCHCDSFHDFNYILVTQGSDVGFFVSSRLLLRRHKILIAYRFG